MLACGITNPIAGAGSFFAGRANAFLFQFYLFAGFRLGLDAGAFSARRGGGFYPVTDLTGCRTFGLNAFLFLYYFLAGQGGWTQEHFPAAPAVSIQLHTFPVVTHFV
jgi:hypothetical protein